jgi:hypothetical protein
MDREAKHREQGDEDCDRKAGRWEAVACQGLEGINSSARQSLVHSKAAARRPGQQEEGTHGEGWNHNRGRRSWEAQVLY